MSSKITFYFVRHAESLSNVSMGTEKTSNPKLCGLTEKGRLQACRLREHLSFVKFARIYSSDYRRAVETAELILECKSQNETRQLLQLEIQMDKNLREMDFGIMKNATYSEITMKYMTFKKPTQEWGFADGETFGAVGQRMVNFFEKICKEIFNDSYNNLSDTQTNVLVVSHSMAITAFLHFLSYSETHSHNMINWNAGKDLKIVQNACYCKLEVSQNLEKLQTCTQSIEKKVISLNIQVLEKYVSSHLSEGQLDKCEKSGLAKEEETKLEETLKQSEKGREILNCSQQ